MSTDPEQGDASASESGPHIRGQLVRWEEGTWTNPPNMTERSGSQLIVEAREGSDAWRKTSYGFVRSSEHGLLAAFPHEGAMEVSFRINFTEQFDQAGLFLRASDTHWIKAGVEYADGVPQLGVVVTNEVSDWSAAPVADWHGRVATVRASRSGNAITVRARMDDRPFQFVRLLPMAPEVELEAGPFTCAPTRSGLRVQFHRWWRGQPDARLH